MNHLSALIAQEETASGSAAFQFVLLAAVPLALYFLMIRPQRRKMREAAEMQASLAVGDEVITGSGIYGFITAVEDDLFWIEVDEDVQLRVVKSQVHGRVSGQAAPAADDDDQDVTIEHDEEEGRSLNEINGAPTYEIDSDDE